MSTQVSEEDLWRYIDDECTAAERVSIEEAIALDPQLHVLFSRLVAMHERVVRYFNARQHRPDRVSIPRRAPDLVFGSRLN